MQCPQTIPDIQRAHSSTYRDAVHRAHSCSRPCLGHTCMYASLSACQALSVSLQLAAQGIWSTVQSRDASPAPHPTSKLPSHLDTAQ
eukprot:scaffold12730_cov20-Tisochrysis_lutea.AAC.1